VYGPDKSEKLGDVTITYPEWCKVTVYRMVGGSRVAFTALERWKENYATKSARSQEPNAMWKKRPYGQLAKCAEAQALRKAFPDAVGAAPTADEMEGKSFDFDLDAATGDARPVGDGLMPARKTAAATGEVVDVAAKTVSSPAPSPAPADRPPAPPATASAGTINAGQVKYLQQKIASHELSEATVAQMLARHGIKALDTGMTVEQFDALKSELIAL
jgi:hypothetical protein